MPSEEVAAAAREEPWESRARELSPQHDADQAPQDPAQWLARLDPERFGDLTLAEVAALTELDLRGLEVTDADLARLSAFPNLERLGLRGTPITDDGLAHLSHLVGLAFVDLRATAVSGQGLGYLPRGLEALHLTDTRVLGSDLHALPPMPYLNQIKLNRLEVDDAALDLLAGYPALSHVELDGTQITGDGLHQLLYTNPELTRLEIRGTEVSAEALNELRQLYPNCEFVQDSGIHAQLMAGHGR